MHYLKCGYIIQLNGLYTQTFPFFAEVSLAHKARTDGPVTGILVLEILARRTKIFAGKYGSPL